MKELQSKAFSIIITTSDKILWTYIPVMLISLQVTPDFPLWLSMALTEFRGSMGTGRLSPQYSNAVLTSVGILFAFLVSWVQSRSPFRRLLAVFLKLFTLSSWGTGVLEWDEGLEWLRERSTDELRLLVCLSEFARVSALDAWSFGVSALFTGVFSCDSCSEDVGLDRFCRIASLLSIRSKRASS